MTRYSIPSENPPQNLVSPPELETLDWESRMARLVGLEEESSSANTDEAVEESTSSLQPLSEPQELRTKEPLSSNPFAKLGLVSAGTLALVLVAGVFLSQLMNTGKQQPKKNNSVSTRSQPISDSRPQQLQSELETLKTKLALTEQAEAVKAAQQKLRLQKPTPPQLASRPTSQPQPSASVNRLRIPLQKTPTPVRTVYVPRVVTVERVVKAASVPQKPANSQILPSPLPIVAPNTQPIVTVTPKPTPDPLQEWAKLAKIGSYGMVSMTGNSVQAATPTPPPTPVNNTQLQARNTEPDDEPPEESTPAVSQTKQQTPKSVAVGSRAKAVFATAVFGETTRSTSRDDKKDESGKDVFVVRLKEPLKSVDGAPALPAKTEFLAQVRSISEQGFLQMDVVKVIIPNNNNLTEKSLPQNAITIRAPQGKPLIASQFSNQGGSLVGLADVGAFVLNGLGRAGQIYNSPETRIECVPSSTTTQGANGTVVTNNCFSTSDSKRNILAGVLEGGATNIANQISQRNQQNFSKRQAQRTNVWFLPAGKEIEVYVNQTTQF
jgi:Bacterial conjugation TrbI-like protein